MSKKQISNRLNKLFDDIKEQEEKVAEPTPPPQKSEPKNAKKTKRHAETEGPSFAAKYTQEEELKALNVQIDRSGSYAALSLPIRTDRETWANLQVVDKTAQREWDIEEQLLVQQVGDQLELALENARLFQETQRRNEELNTLNTIIGSASETLDLNTSLAQVLEKTIEFLHVDAGLISMVDPTSQSLQLNVWKSLPKPLLNKLKKHGLEDTSCGYVYKTRAPLVLPNFKAGRTPLDVSELLELGFAAYFGFPLLARDQIVGTLCLFHSSPLYLTPEDTALLSSVGRQVGFSIENARLFQETQRRTEELALINRITAAVSSSLDLKEDLQIITEEVAKISNALHVGVALLDEEKENLVITAEYPPTDAAGIKIPLKNNKASQQVIETLAPLVITDVPNNPLAKNTQNMMKERGIESFVIFPIVIGNAAIGTLGVDFASPFETLTESQINLIQTILLQASTSIETARLFTKTQESEAEFRSLFAAMDDVIFIVDRDTRYLRIAPTNPSGLYKPPEELIGKRMDEILPEETHELFHNAIEEALATNKTINIEYPLEINERETWFYASLSKLGENQVYWVARDITNRIQNERALKRQNEYMTAAAEVGRLVTETLDLSILFRRAVNLLQEHFGYYHASIFTLEETGFHAILREATGEAGKAMKEQEHSLAVGSKSVVGQATDSGEPYIVNDVSKDSNHHVNPLLPETKSEAAIPLTIGRRILGAVDLQSTEINAFTPNDISVLQILANQFATAIDNARSYELAQKSFEDMRELERLKSQFLANMSHELRTPLNSIIGFSRVIIKGIDGPITDLQEQDLTAIYNSGQHLLGLINDILDLSKLEAGKMELTFDKVDIEKLIKSVMSTVLGLIKDKPVKLEEKIEENLPRVKADSMRLRQVLINFFSNAAKFTNEGSITVIAKRDNNFVRVSVTDSGPGISEENQEKLFRAFSQVDASSTRATGGTGLGLSISKELISMHGGDIGVESAIGKGSTFYFTVPIYLEEKSESEEVAETFTEQEKIAPQDDLVILAIDDDEKVIQLYQRYLNKQGYRVIPLTEPQKAVARAAELRPYAITLDIMMPHYDGWQVLEALKSNPETQHYPIIICSIIADSEKGYALGATDYLLKPIIEDDLLEALNRINKQGSLHEILIIDDDSNDLRLLEKYLNESGKYIPVIANNGPAGWDLMVNNPPQAVLLDLFMPEMGGFEIIDAMQENERLKNIPVIVISGGDINATQKEKLESLNHRLLKKGSLSAEELINSLERSLNHFS